MNGHPGGTEHTRRLLELANLPRGARIIDLGAGAGEAVQLMREQGFDALGIDLRPRSELVEKGDMHASGFPSESFDAVLSQCAFFLSGDPPAALQEAQRILKPEGLLLLSDVFFEEPIFPGYTVLYTEDLTQQWRDYYLGLLWEGKDCGCDIPKKKCSYQLIIARKD